MIAIPATDRHARLEEQKALLAKRSTIRLDTATREGRDLSADEKDRPREGRHRARRR